MAKIAIMSWFYAYCSVFNFKNRFIKQGILGKWSTCKITSLKTPTLTVAYIIHAEQCMCSYTRSGHCLSQKAIMSWFSAFGYILNNFYSFSPPSNTLILICKYNYMIEKSYPDGGVHCSCQTINGEGSSYTLVVQKWY